MVSVIPEGVYTMQDRMSIIYKNATKYPRAKHKVKSQMLNELSQMLHMNRKYLALLLRNTGKVRYTAQGLKLVGDPRVTYLHKRGCKKHYTEAIIPYLKMLDNSISEELLKERISEMLLNYNYQCVAID